MPKKFSIEIGVFLCLHFGALWLYIWIGLSTQFWQGKEECFQYQCERFLL